MPRENQRLRFVKIDSRTGVGSNALIQSKAKVKAQGSWNRYHFNTMNILIIAVTNSKLISSI